MNRKRYIHKLWHLSLLIRDSFPEIYEAHHGKMGATLRYVKEHAKTVPVNTGSYKKAWDDLQELKALIEKRSM